MRQGSPGFAAHCAHVSEQDIDLRHEFEVGVAHSPVCNLKLSSGVALVPMVARGRRVGLVTVGTASSNTLNLLRDYGSGLERMPR